ncbi:PREDICTED: E3 ubiquitin-protein ligase NEURL3, partial [Ceratotherium simum simum]|uniref:E3 ubiquitin-protein ligase NEURL3 n=1 Tax=Ceratotherium simum simum TaxID=73337 RepID=A0ABM1D5I4_CERSS
EARWCGGLRVGFTRLDPARLAARSLPPFVCPDLELQSPTWAAVLPEGSAFPGNVVCFWVNRRGRLFAEVNAGPRLLLRTGVLMGAPLWAVMDVYGTTKAIQLLGAAARRDPWGEGRLGWFSAPILSRGKNHSCHNQRLPQSPAAVPFAPMCSQPLLSPFPATAGEECTICFHRAANTRFVPCGHTHFCSHCAWHVFRDTAKCPLCRWEIEEVVLVWGSSLSLL